MQEHRVRLIIIVLIFFSLAVYLLKDTRIEKEKKIKETILKSKKTKSKTQRKIQNKVVRRKRPDPVFANQNNEIKSAPDIDEIELPTSDLNPLNGIQVEKDFLPADNSSEINSNPIKEIEF